MPLAVELVTQRPNNEAPDTDTDTDSNNEPSGLGATQSSSDSDRRDGNEELDSLISADGSSSLRISRGTRARGGDSSNGKVILTTLFVMFCAFAIGFTITSKENDKDSTAEIDPLLMNKQKQIANYIKGNALIVSIHITHHAGTSVCHEMKKKGPSPPFACMGKGRKETDEPWPDDLEFPHHRIKFNDTEKYVSSYHKYFHFISWEYRSWADLHPTNWEYENLVSMIVMRDPIERFLAGGKCGAAHGVITSDPTNETQDLYWQFANSECADNYALKILADRNYCAHGSDTSIACLESAKNLLRRFTFILDQACLDESMVAVGDELHLNITEREFENGKKSLHTHPGTRERIGNDTLYEYLQTRFRRDIELYEWSKARSIVQCNSPVSGS